MIAFSLSFSILLRIASFHSLRTPAPSSLSSLLSLLSRSSCHGPSLAYFAFLVFLSNFSLFHRTLCFLIAPFYSRLVPFRLLSLPFPSLHTYKLKFFTTSPYRVASHRISHIAYRVTVVSRRGFYRISPSLQPHMVAYSISASAWHPKTRAHCTRAAPSHSSCSLAPPMLISRSMTTPLLPHRS